MGAKKNVEKSVVVWSFAKPFPNWMYAYDPSIYFDWSLLVLQNFVHMDCLLCRRFLQIASRFDKFHRGRQLGNQQLQCFQGEPYVHTNTQKIQKYKYSNIFSQIQILQRRITSNQKFQG